MKDVETARLKGYFLTEREGRMCVVVRHMLATVMFEKPGEDTEILDELQDAIPLGRFGLVQVVKSLRTELMAE